MSDQSEKKGEDERTRIQSTPKEADGTQYSTFIGCQRMQIQQMITDADEAYGEEDARVDA